MCVGIDHERDARAHGRPCVDVGEVAPVGVGVDLEHRPRSRRRLEHGIEVDRVRGPALDQAPGRVADRAHERVLDRGDHPLGHRLLAHPERGVRAGDHPVEPFEQLVVVVERAVREDVDLAAGEQLDAVDARVRLVHELDLPSQLLR